MCGRDRQSFLKKGQIKEITINYSQCGKNEEDGEIDLDDNSQVVLGEGVGKVGDEDEHGGGQEGGEQVAGQRTGQLENNFKTQVAILEFLLKCNL